MACVDIIAFVWTSSKLSTFKFKSFSFHIYNTSILKSSSFVNVNNIILFQFFSIDFSVISLKIIKIYKKSLKSLNKLYNFCFDKLLMIKRLSLLVRESGYISLFCPFDKNHWTQFFTWIPSFRPALYLLTRRMGT